MVAALCNEKTNLVTIDESIVHSKTGPSIINYPTVCGFVCGFVCG